MDCGCDQKGCTMERSACEKECVVPSGERYQCDWHDTHPKCMKTDDGKMSQAQCEADCKPA
jgi:hypothetical protein